MALAGLQWLPAWALPARRLVFPRDHGSHPEFQTEWWYVTGTLRTDDPTAGSSGGSREYGFQITFFRSRVAATQSMRSSFAARQLLFAHAAVTDVAAGKLHHDQRIAREGHGLAQASLAGMDVAIGDWRLVTEAATSSTTQQDVRQRHRAQVSGAQLHLDLLIEDSQPLLLQGRDGLSRKGPLPEQASYYYSRPQLKVTGTLMIADDRRSQRQVHGTAWLDHEWSNALLSREAQGWDWMGMNLDDGSALTVFQLRKPDGTALWAGGSWRAPGQAARIFEPHEAQWQPRRHWQSPRSGTRYPVEWQVTTPVGQFIVRAMVEDQELDASASTGGIYWEGLSSLTDTRGQRLGSGYLEMTGYHAALRVSQAAPARPSATINA